MTTRPKYASVRIPAALRDELQSEALILSAEVGRRLAISDIVAADRIVTAKHRDELRTAIATDQTGE